MGASEPLRVGIVGIGRVGLPFALALAEIGCQVVGVDRSETLIATLLRGEMPFLEEGAEPILRRHIGKSFRPTTSYAALADAQVVVLTPGTPVDDNMNPVMDELESCTRSLLPHVAPGTVIILRSTVSPRTTEYVARLIESESSFRVGHDLFLAFCPERIAEGRALKELSELPQIVGAQDDESARRAIALFDKFGVRSLRTDWRSAELAKLFTNMYRYVQFAIANEFMLIAQSYDRDIYPIVDLVNRDYKRGGLAYPGFTAGPCLYKDGFFLINHVPYTDLIATSWKMNESVPLFLVSQIRAMRPLAGAKVALLGMAFKADIDDARQSLSFKVRKAFKQDHAIVQAHDPYVPRFKGNLDDALRDADVIFLAQRHDEYRAPEFRERLRLAKPDAIVCDLWNILATDRIIFELSELPGAANQPRAVAARS